MTEEAGKRRYPRLAASQVIRLRKSSPEKAGLTRDGILENISLGGAFIEEIAPWFPCPEGTLVEFDLRLPNYATEIPVVAVVRHCQTDQEPKGIGVKFVKIEDEALAALGRYIDAYESER